MGLHGWIWSIVAVILLMHEQPCFARFDNSLYCSICRAVVEEINARINEADPSRKVKVTSFRMGPDGKKHVTQKPYARSNEHLSKIFDDVCESMDDYGLRQLPGGKMTIVRTRTREGLEIYAHNVGVTDALRQTFKGYCQDLVSENDDDMWTLFKLENLHAIESELCGKIIDKCTEEDLSRPFSDQQPTQSYDSDNFYNYRDDDVEEEYDDDEDHDIKPEPSTLHDEDEDDEDDDAESHDKGDDEDEDEDDDDEPHLRDEL